MIISLGSLGYYFYFYYFFLFKKWQCSWHMKVKGKTLNFDITNIYRNVYNPVWGFVFSKQIEIIAN
jgi:hypothetical protein